MGNSCCATCDTVRNRGFFFNGAIDRENVLQHSDGMFVKTICTFIIGSSNQLSRLIICEPWRANTKWIICSVNLIGENWNGVRENGEENGNTKKEKEMVTNEQKIIVQESSVAHISYRWQWQYNPSRRTSVIAYKLTVDSCWMQKHHVNYSIDHLFLMRVFK